MSDAVAQIRRELSLEALESAAQGREFACLETVPFGYFQYPKNVGLVTIWITLESDVEYCVDRFMESVRGPVREWFAQRASMADLIALAPTPKLTSPDRLNPDPVRLRGVVILALLEGRTGEAVSLVRRYREREQYHAWDSAERVAAFDSALAQRYPEYARARKNSGDQRPDSTETIG